MASRLPNGAMELEIYVSTRTPFDYWHGVDMFLMYYNHIVTFDLTVQHKKDHYKADYLITRENILSDQFYKLARHIARKLGGRN